jgi:sporulation protein YlmC with PRC-barrel domain
MNENDIPLDARVECTDEYCGRITHVVLKSNTREVTHIVVQDTGVFNPPRIIPISLVGKSTPEVIQLRCTHDELGSFPSFTETELVKTEMPGYVNGPYSMPTYYPAMQPVEVEHEMIPQGELALRRGARVVATDGQIGRVDGVLVDPNTEDVTHLVLREGHLWATRDIAIPVSEIADMDEDEVRIRLDKDGIEALPSIPLRSSKE